MRPIATRASRSVPIATGTVASAGAASPLEPLASSRWATALTRRRLRKRPALAFPGGDRSRRRRPAGRHVLWSDRSNRRRRRRVPQARVPLAGHQAVLEDRPELCDLTGACGARAPDGARLRAPGERRGASPAAMPPTSPFPAQPLGVSAQPLATGTGPNIGSLAVDIRPTRALLPQSPPRASIPSAIRGRRVTSRRSADADGEAG